MVYTYVTPSTPVYENLIELTGKLNFEISLDLRKSIINITTN